RASAISISAVTICEGSGVHIGGLLDGRLIERDRYWAVLGDNDGLGGSDSLRRVRPMRQDQGKADFTIAPLNRTDDPIAWHLRDSRAIRERPEIEQIAVDAQTIRCGAFERERVITALRGE